MLNIFVRKPDVSNYIITQPHVYFNRFLSFFLNFYLIFSFLIAKMLIRNCKKALDDRFFFEKNAQIRKKRFSVDSVTGI